MRAARFRRRASLTLAMMRHHRPVMMLATVSELPQPERVWSTCIHVCSHCWNDWREHLFAARDRLRTNKPGEFYIRDGIEYPTFDSTLIEEAVTTVDCATVLATLREANARTRAVPGDRPTPQGPQNGT